MTKYDVAIIGGGIVGLATARALAKSNPKLKIAVFEKEARVGKHQTSHNSGVIHSGIYYKPGSLKAENCRRGYQLMVDFARENGIAHDICGKVIVATEPEEIPRLEELHRRGVANGLDRLRYLTPEELKDHEPHCVGLQALWVPQAGIIDYQQVVDVYAQKLQEGGQVVQTGSALTAVTGSAGNFELQFRDKPSVQAKVIVNTAGLHCDQVGRLSGFSKDLQIVPFRGEYYELKPEAASLVRNLIYPVPDPNFPFLGVHFTRMIKGGVEAGPNAVLALKREGYRKSDISLTDLTEMLAWPGVYRFARKHWRAGLNEYHRSFSKAAFTRSLQKLIPHIREDDLQPGGSGVRAQACGRDGKLFDDFVIEGRDNMVHVLNAPSPAATSSLAIGQTVAESVIRNCGI